MTDELPLVILLQTYARTAYAVETIRSVLANLLYSDPVWYVADDGSDEAHHTAILNALAGQIIGREHNHHLGYGETFNRAIDVITGRADVVLFLEDDWRLTVPFDPQPYIDTLRQNDQLGMIRLSYLPVGLDCHSVGYNGRVYLRTEKSTQYCYTGNPALRHARFWQSYGPLPEGRNPGQTEIDYDGHVRETAGPEIVWPVDIGAYGLFHHIGTDKSYKD